MSKEIIDKVALLYIRNKQVLSTQSKNKSKLYFPGGKREGSESDLACLLREVKEELDVDILDDTVQYFDVFEAPADGHDSDTVVRMRCYFADFIGQLKASSEIEHFEWISVNDKHRTSAVDQLIIDRLQALRLIH